MSKHPSSVYYKPGILQMAIMEDELDNAVMVQDLIFARAEVAILDSRDNDMPLKCTTMRSCPDI